MMRPVVTFLLALLAVTAPRAQHAVVDDHLTEVTVSSATRAVTHQRQTVTIRDEQGADKAFFLCRCSKQERLTSFRGEAVDAQGRQLRKFRQGDLRRTEYSPYLAIDDYQLYLDYTPPSYPITITYEWSMELRNTLIEYPPYCPQDDYEVSVRHALYRLTVPADINVRHALQNIGTEPQTTTDADGRRTLTLDVTDLPALHDEPYARPLRERLPLAYFAPRRFTYYGTEGSLDTWADYGRWERSLLEGRDALPEALRTELHQLTDTLPTARQKVHALYRYLGRNTRYVAILLGIGGQQPAPAAEVAGSGFGDCKGLSNLMRAMLREVGISSRYTTISTHNRRLLPHFASVGQMNHVILQVPLPQDTLWLECTNPELPFGYVHEDIAGHDAIAVDDDGGHLVRLPAYADTLNCQRSRISISLTPDGDANIRLRQVSENRQYEALAPMLRMDPKDRQRTLRQLLRAPQADIGRISVSQPDDSARLTLEADISSRGYAVRSGQRLFLPLCPIHQGYGIASPGHQRTEPLAIDMGYQDEDRIDIDLPEGYTLEARPKNIRIEKPFGSFLFQTKVAEGRLKVRYRVVMHAGTYPASQYADFEAFIKSISRAYAQRAVCVAGQLTR